MPAHDPVRVVFQEQFQGGRREAPIIRRIIVNLEMEGARHQQGAVRPEHPADLLEAAPEMRHVLEGVHGDDRAHRGVGLGQALDVGYQVHPRPRPPIQADVGLAVEKAAQVGNSFLTLDLVGADLYDRPRQIKGFRHRPGHALQKVIHTLVLASRERKQSETSSTPVAHAPGSPQFRLKSIAWANPPLISQVSPERSGSQYFSGKREGCTLPPRRTATVTR